MTVERFQAEQEDAAQTSGVPAAELLQGEKMTAYLEAHLGKLDQNKEVDIIFLSYGPALKIGLYILKKEIY